MDNQTFAIQSSLSALLLSSILLLGFTFTGTSHATPLTQSGQGYGKTSIQLAHGGPRHRHHRHHRNRHWRGGGYMYFGPGYRRPSAYWTGWRVYHRHGRRCARKCLVNRYTGRIIRCHRRCY